VRLILGAILVISLGAAVSAEPARSSGAVVPGSVGNEVHINVSNASRAPLVGLTAAAVAVPAAILNLTIEPSRIDRIEHDRSAEFTIRFDVAPGAPEGELDPIRFEVSVEEGTLDETRAELRLTVTPAPSMTACVIRADAPDDFPVENTVDYCDFEQQTTEFDRVGVFFTPPRDLSEPIEEREPFHWRILGPNGNVQRIRSGTYDTVQVFAPREELSTPFAKEGSPGRFAAVIDLWDRRDDPDPAAAHSGPGTYTVETVQARYAPVGVFGQDSVSSTGRAIVDEDENGNPVFAEWEPAVQFEVASARLYFQGFVAEQVIDQFVPARDYPRGRHIWEGKITVDSPQVTGSTVTLGANAWVRNAIINGNGRFPAEEIQRAGSRVTLKFPEQLDPGHEKLGEIGIEVEPLEKSDYLFTAGMHLMVPTTKAPPDRYLVQGTDFPAAWSEDGDRYEAGCPTIFGGFGVDYEGGSGDANGVWVFPRAFNPSACWVDEVVQGQTRVILLSGEKDDLVGRPVRSLPEHLRDAKTLWVIPVFLTLTDSASPRDRTLDLKTYGYAMYAARTGTYAGPLPVDGPEEGTAAESTSGDPPATGDEPVVGGDPTGGGDPVVGGDPTTGGNPTGGNPTGGGDLTGGGNPTGGGDPTGGDPVVGVPIGAGDPAAIDPNDPNIAPLIREWLEIAEPVENAGGANFRYDRWGRLVGSAAPGMGETRPGEQPPPDGGAGRPEAYAWERRAALDSIDNCTLEEYVVTILAGESTSHCMGRYPRTVAAPNVTGLPLADAVERLRRQGLEVSPRLLGAAPSPNAAGRVAAQRPAANERMARGATVELDLYGDYSEPAVGIPDLTGRTMNEAQQALASAGLTLAPRLIGPAPTPEQSRRVAGQRPAAGVSVAPGSSVEIDVYGDYVAPGRVLPDVVGLTLQEASAALQTLSLAIEPALRGPAPSPTEALRVASQEPAAGSSVTAGATVQVELWGDYVSPQPDVPNLIETGNRLGPEVPDLQCPATMTFVKVADRFLSDQLRPLWPPPRYQAPLVEWDAEPGAIDGKSGYHRHPTLGYNLFTCRYAIGNTGLTYPAFRLYWKDSASGPWEPYPDYCHADGEYGGTWHLFSATRKVEAWVDEGSFDMDELTGIVRHLIRQVEPYAVSCGETGGGGAGGGGTGGGAGGGASGGGGNAAGNIAGTYTTTFGGMTLTAQGNRLSGEYVRGGRVYIESSEDGGRVIHGTWVQPDSARRCASERYGSSHWGRFTFRFNDRFSAFNGEYGYCDEATAGDWSGSKSGGDRPPTPGREPPDIP
jgi:beta-lactam-binding protein with PASTA domain